MIAAGMFVAPALAQEPPTEKEFRRFARRAAPRDAFPVLNNPEMVSAKRADSFLSDDDPVIGIDLGGEQKAYPVSIMGRHELANDTCGKIPLAVSW